MNKRASARLRDASHNEDIGSDLLLYRVRWFSFSSVVMCGIQFVLPVPDPRECLVPRLGIQSAAKVSFWCNT